MPIYVVTHDERANTSGKNAVAVSADTVEEAIQKITQADDGWLPTGKACLTVYKLLEAGRTPVGKKHGGLPQ